ncbi:MAG: CDP-diacylglycerol--glycerol-3-phosphate 3-phosphatidyltransferase [Candidatus Zixiibacteriota bacterium]|nr:MAG: CDP-diacylglycerol--glycerol-3-phosphate 3-phosphatidyltransferase [candidate division Zixibacteria bacterium]
MNTPNKLTLSRIVIAPIFMYFLILDNYQMRLIALGLFIIASLTDLADGYYARKYGIVTGFGKFMDPLADKILVSSALIAFISLKYVNPLPVMLIIGREFAITGLRLLAAYRGVVISPSWWAKVKTFLQMGIVGLMLAFINLISTIEYFNNSIPSFLMFDYQFYFNLLTWITAIVTVLIGIDYVIKYFYMIKTVLK